MRKRIYIGLLFVTLITLSLASVFLSIFFSRAMETREMNELKRKAQFMAAMAVNIPDANLYPLMQTDPGERVEITDDTGRVLFSQGSGAALPGYTVDTPELREADTGGFGEDIRFDAGLGGRSYFYALRLADGRFLSMSKKTDGLLTHMASAAPGALLIGLGVLVVNLVLSAWLTKSIIAPINRIDLDDPEVETYEELTVFIRTILHQRALIEDQMRSLEKRAATIQSIIDHMREGFLMINKAGVVAAVNQSVLRIFGATSDCVGRDMLHLTRNVDFLQNVKQALQGRDGDMLMERDRTYRVFINAVTGDGVIVLFVDITDSQRAEQMRRNFTANVSHELKTPLTCITGYAEIVLAGLANPADVGHFTGKIRDEAAHMTALVDDILFLSRLDEPGQNRVFESFDLTALAAEAIEARQVSAEAGSVTLHLQGEPLPVRANRMLIYELLVNLIDNGVKYNVPQGRVTVRVERNDVAVQITVTDTGIGIPEAHIPRIFERFYRVDPSRSRKTGGTGLGLSIVKHIAQYHDGSVDIESRLNEGTRVRVTWPDA